MSGKTKLVSVVGARPQFVKLAPISRATDANSGVEHRVVHTGQHYDDSMSASFFEQLELPRPDLDLGVGSGTHGQQTAAMLSQLESYFTEHRPDAVLTYGDTNSTLAATLAATKIHVPVAHIEAGLRSFNRLMPEEINRLVADHCADRLYAPTPQAMTNLRNENLADRAVHSGDVMLDAVQHNIGLADAKSTALEKYDLKTGGFGLVTVHRPSNTTGDELHQLLGVLEHVAGQHLPLVFPVHPRTRAVLKEMAFEPPDGLTLLDPLPYLDNIALIKAAALVVTDSGGVQKEAAILHTPCMTMRDETEWTETVEIGVNFLVGNTGTRLVETVGKVLKSGDLFGRNTVDRIKEQYGGGDAAIRIIDDCVEWLQ